MTITIDAAAAHLNDHSRVFSDELFTTMQQGLEIESIAAARSAEGEYYVAENAEAGEALQPYQAGFTPKGSVTLSETPIRVRPGKVDLTFSEDDVFKWWTRWKASRFEAGKDPLTWTYPRFVLERVIMPKILSDVNNAEWNGVYAAPTPGTPGAAVDSWDGFKKKIADLVTAGTINVVATGAITLATTREKVETFVDGIPDLYRTKGGVILMSWTHFANYSRDYRNEFQHIPGMYNQNNAQVMSVQVDGYNIFLKPVNTMASSSRWIFLPNGRENMIWISREGYPIYPQFKFNTAPRVLSLDATIYRGVGFEYPKEVWVNDQV